MARPRLTQRASRARSLRAAAVLLLVAPGAAGADLWTEGTFAAQLYEQRSPWGEPRLTRRRYTETLEVRAEDLTGDALGGGPRLTAGARLRLDSDLAVAAAERTPGNPGSFVPGAADSRLDIMTATLEGRRIGGVL
ncbi:MAG: hypothetical protein FJ104_13375, partial [Deltaproteobacteria bacterium]|nr:hypothetical protein [Deltaproteobacteria bacterium]